MLENILIWLNLQALHLICWYVEQPRTYLFVFRIHWCLLPEYSFKTCPALVGGTLASCLLNGTP